MLRTRVFPKNDPQIPKDTFYVFPKLKSVSEYNQKLLNGVEGESEVIISKNILPCTLSKGFSHILASVDIYEYHI